MWLGVATIAVAALPLTLRFAAAIDSYTIVAVVDVALVLFNIPTRMGAIIVAAVIPHATRAVDKGDTGLKISLREHVLVVAPFVCTALIVAFTPIIGWIFGLVGKPTYDKSADYLALVLLAGPARLLYGLVEGMLVARGEGRFMALNALAITAVALGLILLSASLGDVPLAFVVFVAATWAVYLCGLRRILHPIATTHEGIGASTH